VATAFLVVPIGTIPAYAKDREIAVDSEYVQTMEMSQTSLDRARVSTFQANAILLFLSGPSTARTAVLPALPVLVVLVIKGLVWLGGILVAALVVRAFNDAIKDITGDDYGASFLDWLHKEFEIVSTTLFFRDVENPTSEELAEFKRKIRAAADAYYNAKSDCRRKGGRWQKRPAGCNVPKTTFEAFSYSW
jgi:hypothetical protein